MIVVDTNIIAYYCMGEDNAAAAEKLARTDGDWRAPELWRSEFRNVLAGHMRRRGMGLQLALATMERAERRMARRHDRVASEWLLPLIAESRCTAYDLEFVALARQLQAPLFTADRELLQAYPNVARSLG